MRVILAGAAATTLGALPVTRALTMFREHGLHWAPTGTAPVTASRGECPVNPVENAVHTFRELVAQVPDLVQPIVVMLAGAVPFVEGEGATVVGILGGVHPLLAGLAAAIGNLVCVTVVVLLSSRARSAVTRRIAAGESEDVVLSSDDTRSVSKGRQRFQRWLVRFGVPGASILGPLAIPTQITSAILVAGGTAPRWVLLWQGVAILLWTTVATLSAWGALTLVVGV